MGLAADLFTNPIFNILGSVECFSHLTKRQESEDVILTHVLPLYLEFALVALDNFFTGPRLWNAAVPAA
ncbi:unnamed protein product [Dovyalis caffra]|uniref:Uncharacterized protein n=1 Tax=Dovyalis caffra TaxID=77055 RepID=A0AAV1SR79_9ROSI|nr:unnamed protein product [Dovyalis caffra]